MGCHKCEGGSGAAPGETVPEVCCRRSCPAVSSRPLMPATNDHHGAARPPAHHVLVLQPTIVAVVVAAALLVGGAELLIVVPGGGAMGRSMSAELGLTSVAAVPSAEQQVGAARSGAGSGCLPWRLTAW